MGAKVFLIHLEMGTFGEFTNKFRESAHLMIILKHLYLELPLLDLTYMIDNSPKNMEKIILGRMQMDADIFFASKL